MCKRVELVCKILVLGPFSVSNTSNHLALSVIHATKIFIVMLYYLTLLLFVIVVIVIIIT